MAVIPPVSQALTEKDIPHQVFRHAQPPHTLEQAAEERGHRPEQVVRSILFRLSKSEYLMVLIAGRQQVDWKTLRRHLGTSRISMASREEVLQITGYELGAVAPFGISPSIRVLVDESVLAQQEISLGSGIRGVAILMRSDDLLLALGEVEVLKLGK